MPLRVETMAEKEEPMHPEIVTLIKAVSRLEEAQAQESRSQDEHRRREAENAAEHRRHMYARVDALRGDVQALDAKVTTLGNRMYEAEAVLSGKTGRYQVAEPKESKEPEVQSKAINWEKVFQNNTLIIGFYVILSLLILGVGGPAFIAAVLKVMGKQ